MTSRSLFISLFLMVAVLLGACSKQETPASAPEKAARQPISLETIAAQAKGFTVGSMMSANTVYVFFDAQCPHCGHLWESALPLQKKLKFVWIPVGWINPSSTTQGAALLTATDPGALMSEHEASLLARKGGISAPSSIPPEIEQAIKSNTQLLTSFGAEAVPFIVARDLKSGQTVSRDGAMSTQALASFLGIEAP